MEEKVGKLEVETGSLEAARNKQVKDKANAQDAINTFWYYLEYLKYVVSSTSTMLRKLIVTRCGDGWKLSPSLKRNLQLLFKQMDKYALDKKVP